jgi:hypothetical protein
VAAAIAPAGHIGDDRRPSSCRVNDRLTTPEHERLKALDREIRAVEDDRLLARIRELHEANYCAYRYRRMWKALRRAGGDVGRDRVRRLMAATTSQARKAARQSVAHDDQPSRGAAVA